MAYGDETVDDSVIHHQEPRKVRPQSVIGAVAIAGITLALRLDALRQRLRDQSGSDVSRADGRRRRSKTRAGSRRTDV